MPSVPASMRTPASTGTAGRIGSPRATQVTASARTSRSTRNFTVDHLRQLDRGAAHAARPNRIVGARDDNRRRPMGRMTLAARSFLCQGGSRLRAPVVSCPQLVVGAETGELDVFTIVIAGVDVVDKSPYGQVKSLFIAWTALWTTPRRRAPGCGRVRAIPRLGRILGTEMGT
ncbi:hypothetical protein BN11_1550003 [Nostocoides australiense Ben110]|uniref:Uncharacterized protein n=1 Tax=Nostocoides australiense Ben110 TaxID=1193182 RepID=W6JUS6_9MICO|nr:hypothetical protein BN11_1550003 [Tetrasphaera australiensis Ben110]